MFTKYPVRDILTRIASIVKGSEDSTKQKTQRVQEKTSALKIFKKVTEKLNLHQYVNFEINTKKKSDCDTACTENLKVLGECN